jgi:hypothetical protein
MSEQHIPTRAELLEALRASAREVVTGLSGQPVDVFKSGCYENGWTRRQVLAHVASIEWTYARLIDLAAGGGTPQGDKAGAPQTAASGPPQRPAQGGINDYNQRQVDKLSDASVPELIDLFRKNRAATIAAVEGVSDSLLAQPVRSAGGLSGPLGVVLDMVAVQHVRGHVRDILATDAAAR